MDEQLREQLIRDYSSGMTLAEVRTAHPWVSMSALRAVLGGYMRPRGSSCKNADPSPEEIAREREQFKAGWDAETARRRWVGRFASVAEARGEQMSRMLAEYGVWE